KSTRPPISTPARPTAAPWSAPCCAALWCRPAHRQRLERVPRNTSMNTSTIRFQLNGADTQLQAPTRTTLADCLRHHLHQTGTHVACEHGVCGACTVIVDGDAVRSCLMLAV